MADTYVTKAPTGLQVERNGNEFTCSWKIRDVDYGKKQEFQWQSKKGGSWHKVLITTKQTSVVVAVQNVANVSRFSFKVKGWRKSFNTKVETGEVDKNGNKKTKDEKVPTTESPWKVKDAGWVPEKPTAPTVSFELLTANSGKFTVEHDADINGSKIAKYVQYQTCISTSSANPPKTWSGTVTNIDGSANVSREITYTEQNEDILKTGLVRWFRARCSGPGGDSKWVYAHHAYSKPEAPALKSASAREVAERAATVITAQWINTESILRPIDEEKVQYVIGIPTDDACTAPASGWQDAISVTPSGKMDKVSASVSDMLADEQCMWVRIASIHDTDRISYSRTQRVLSKRLKAPGINATPNFTTGAVSITLTINTQCSVAKHAIFYRDPKKPKANVVVAILAAGVTTTTLTVPAIVGQSKSCFGAYAFVGTQNGLSINAIMTSPSALDEDIAAVAPNTPVLSRGPDNTSVFVGLSWRWSGATDMELTWADNQYAWNSNESPKSCTITDIGAKTWLIKGLEAGKTWYFRARYHGLIDEDDVTSAWSEISQIDLATTPETPTLTLSSGFVLRGVPISASWDYVNEDESPQDYAEVAIVIVVDSRITPLVCIAHTNTAQSVVIRRNVWELSTTYLLSCRVRAASGRYSDWSNPVSVYCPASPSLDFATLPDQAITDGVMSALGVVGISCTADNSTGQYSLSIIRAADYHVDRPDDGIYDGYEGETIWTQSGGYNGGAYTVTYEIEKDDLIGELDDGAPYLLIGSLTDEYGQTATAQMPFKVNWAHKASIAPPSVKSDQRLMAVRITPTKPDGWVDGDVFDIYRITVDQPELIVRDGEYGTTYVDPYPGFGNLCGHRVVAKTATGSYIDEDNAIAWRDLYYDDGDVIDSNSMVIDANGVRIELPYNLELTNKWQKDFKRTSYLGGSVQGDWNPAVLRDLTAKTVIVKNQDTGELMDLRDLAAYTGPAHIRTPDGSSFACDIQVTETASYDDRKVQYSLTVKGIDPQEPEGLTLEEWRELHPVGE